MRLVVVRELHPVLVGSTVGTEDVMRGIAELLPARAGDGDGPLSARVFKIERGPEGDRIAYTRLFSGSLKVRDREQDQPEPSRKKDRFGDNRSLDGHRRPRIGTATGPGSIRR